MAAPAAATPAAKEDETKKKEAITLVSLGDKQRNEKKDYKKAIEFYSEAIEKDPKNCDAYFGRAYCYNEVGKYDEAIQDLNKTIELNPKSDAAYCNRGVAYTNKGNYDKAIEDYEQALKLNPDDEMVKDNLEKVKNIKKQAAEAEAKKYSQLKEQLLDTKLENILSKITFNSIRSDWGEGSEEKQVVKALKGFSDDEFKQIFKNHDNCRKIEDALYNRGRNNYDVVNYILERLSSISPNGNKLYCNRHFFKSNEFCVGKNAPEGFSLIDTDNSIGNNFYNMSITQKDFRRILKEFRKALKSE